RSILHMVLVLFLFATTLLITGLLAIFLPEDMSEAIQYLSLMKLHYLFQIIIIFMLLTTVEFSFIYINLSSNRLFFPEKYIPLVPALFLGWICASTINENDFLDTLSFFGLYLLTFLVDLMIIILLIRLRNVREKFVDRKAERALLTHFIIMLIAFLIYQSGDLIGFIGLIISQDFYILALLSQFILMPVFSFLLLVQSRSIWKILDKINYSLLLNEIN
ncbi:MAG: hypothetical protein ACFFC6_17095, partial [Promethearchaeota archaeon]